jgi:uncharacterized Fe-S center protein
LLSVVCCLFVVCCLVLERERESERMRETKKKRAREREREKKKIQMEYRHTNTYTHTHTDTHTQNTQTHTGTSKPLEVRPASDLKRQLNPQEVNVVGEYINRVNLPSALNETNLMSLKKKWASIFATSTKASERS